MRGALDLGVQLTAWVPLPSRRVSPASAFSSKAGHCWEAGCLVGRCSAYLLEVKLGGRAVSLGIGQEFLQPLWDSEWDPLLHKACFSVASFYSANNSRMLPCAECMGPSPATSLTPTSGGRDLLVMVVTVDQ